MCVTVRIHLAYPPDELVIGFTPKIGVNCLAFAKKAETQHLGGVGEMKTVNVDTPPSRLAPCVTPSPTSESQA